MERFFKRIFKKEKNNTTSNFPQCLKAMSEHTYDLMDYSHKLTMLTGQLEIVMKEQERKAEFEKKIMSK